MAKLTLLLIAVFSLNAVASDLNQQMDSLGSNRELLKKTRAYDPENRARLVQNREVDRTFRLELGVNYGGYAGGGDPFLNTSMWGGFLDFHVSPRWSLGVRYESYSNSLNSEGRSVTDSASQQGVPGPSIAKPRDSYVGVIEFYPIYGKLNLFDSTSQFDIYMLGGAGQINIDTGSVPMYTAGGGVGFWLAKHFTTRLEARWQGYRENVGTSTRQMNDTVLQASIGFLL